MDWLSARRGEGYGLDFSVIENENFQKLEDLDHNIIVRYNEITTQMQALTDHEHLMRDLLIAVQIELEIQQKRQIYLNLKTGHLTAIKGIIEKSDLQ